MNLEYKKSIAWMRENLFSSIPSSILTVATSFFVLGFFRGLFGFAMASDKDWLSVLNNMQLYMVQAYPEEDFPYFLDMYHKGKFPINEMISETFSLNQINEACDKLHNGQIAGRSIIKY